MPSKVENKQEFMKKAIKIKNSFLLYYLVVLFLCFQSSCITGEIQDKNYIDINLNNWKYATIDSIYNCFKSTPKSFDKINGIYSPAASIENGKGKIDDFKLMLDFFLNNRNKIATNYNNSYRYEKIAVREWHRYDLSILDVRYNDSQIVRYVYSPISYAKPIYVSELNHEDNFHYSKMFDEFNEPGHKIECIDVLEYGFDYFEVFSLIYFDIEGNVCYQIKSIIIQ